MMRKKWLPAPMIYTRGTVGTAPKTLPRMLPKWRKYTIDERLQEFRKVTMKDGQPEIIFIPFASKKGMRIQYQIDMEKLKKVI
jgi:hypothetical protein